jgi:hypothetical protein
MLKWCEKNSVDYVVGIARNARLQPLLEPQLLQAKTEFESTGGKSRRFTWLSYKADSWDKGRCVIGKAEYTSQGSNPRFVITSLRGTELAHAQVETIRLKLFKIGTVILRNTRRIQILMSSAFPYQGIFSHLFCALNSS